MGLHGWSSDGFLHGVCLVSHNLAKEELHGPYGVKLILKTSVVLPYPVCSPCCH
jgi:hypothetical protein